MERGFNVGGALGWNFTPELSGGIDVMYTDFQVCLLLGERTAKPCRDGDWLLELRHR